MKKTEAKSNKMILEIGDTIRIKKNNFIKKWFSRNYRTENSIKEFAKAGYPMGIYELSVEDFKSLVEDNLTSHRKMVVKKAKKAYKDGIESIEVGRNTKKDRRAIKSKLSKKNDLSEQNIVKDGGRILFVKKENKKANEEAILNSIDEGDDDWF